jgi:hypothetical protein
MDQDNHEQQPLMEETPSSGRRVGKVLLVSIFLVLAAVAMLAAVLSRPALTVAQLPLATALYPALTSGEQVDFCIFTHVGNPKMLPDVLTYPLEDMVNSEGSKGMIVMYVMSKKEFAMFLDYVNVVANKPKTPLPDELVKLHETCQKHMETANKNMQPTNRVRILTPFDLKDSLISVRHRLGKQQFLKWFGHTTYDAPKFADALLRLRALGNDMPVFRFDIDVLFNKYTKNDISSIKKAVATGIKDVKRCVDDPYVQTFLVSQQYSAVQASRSKDFNAWNEAYSTRANPAMLATLGTTNASQWKADGGWGHFVPPPDVLQQATDEQTMMEFYGLQKVDGNDILQPTTPSSSEDAAQRSKENILKLGNAYIGANPSRAVVSGAALSVGPGVSVDMPPFIHSDLNIMWIDDHIFDRLTQEVAGTKRRPRPEGVGTARVVKARSQPRNLAKYTLEIYMPTLIYGIFMDAWVNNHTSSYLLKYRPTEIPKTDALDKEYAELMASEAMGPWSRALGEVRTHGKMLTDTEKKDVKEELWRASCERAKDVFWQWSKLPQPTIDGKQAATFAALWGTGRICQHENLKGYCNNDGFNKLGQGMVTPEWDKQAKDSLSRTKLPALDRSGFSPALAEKVDQLIEAAIKHIEWTLIWPDVVQAIRDEMVGSVPSDLAYHNPVPIPELQG